MPHSLTLAAFSDIGRIRKRNEDSFLLLDDLGVAAVADGMGAHPGGDVASRLAVERVESRLRSFFSRSLPSTPDAITELLRDVLEQTVREAHATVRAGGEDDPSLEAMGCTLTVLVAEPRSGVCAFGHVGDSRLYRLREGSLVQLSHDDTWVQGLIDAGKLPAERARHHPLGHILTQCIGSPERPEPQIEFHELRAGDLYLLCSDGLVGMLDDAEVAAILHQHVAPDAAAETLRRAARTLVDAANERGGNDNITVALVLVR